MFPNLLPEHFIALHRPENGSISGTSWQTMMMRRMIRSTTSKYKEDTDGVVGLEQLVNFK